MRRTITSDVGPGAVQSISAFCLLACHSYIIPTALVFRLSFNPVLCLQLGKFVYMKFVMFSLNLM